MTSAGGNRFQVFFEDETYIALKNYLYNYLLRKRAVEKTMQDEEKGMILEIGSGLSPVLTSWNQVVYSDLSFSALRQLRHLQERGYFVVADGMNLPFKAGAFSHAISSEVLEHLADDRKALHEMAAVIKPEGALIVTFPHRHLYFANDDRFVHHYRRYELPEMIFRLYEAGLHPVIVQKVLGPLEKITMMLVTGCISIFQGAGHREQRRKTPSMPGGGILVTFFKWSNKAYACFAWVDAFIMPRMLSSVLLIKAVRKRTRQDPSA